MTGRVCQRHEEYAPDGVCRWCEPEAQAPVAQAPPLDANKKCSWSGAGSPCSKSALWGWSKPGQLGVFLYCQDHHDVLVKLHGGKVSYGWQAERLP